jgi:hypothetical protein
MKAGEIAQRPLQPYRGRLVFPVSQAVRSQARAGGAAREPFNDQQPALYSASLRMPGRAGATKVDPWRFAAQLTIMDADMQSRNPVVAG